MYARNQKKESPLLDRGQSGFSLIEVSIITSIIALTSALAIPQLASRTLKLNLINEATSIRLFLERCQTLALSSRQAVEVRISPSQLVANYQNPSAFALNPIQSYALKGRALISDNKQSNRLLIFYPSISATPDSLTISKPPYSCSIIISLRGRIRHVC